MNTDAVFIVCGTLVLLLTLGDPDLIDAAIAYLNNHCTTAKE